jgi:hypothetical protein
MSSGTAHYITLHSRVQNHMQSWILITRQTQPEANTYLILNLVLPRAVERRQGAVFRRKPVRRRENDAELGMPHAAVKNISSNINGVSVLHREHFASCVLVSTATSAGVG